MTISEICIVISLVELSLPLVAGADMSDRESMIVHQLKERLVEHEEEILRAIDALAELDW